MSEPRKPEAINQEYTALCAQAGDLEFKRSLIDADKATIFQKLKFLNEEASAAHKYWASKAEQEDKVAPPKLDQAIAETAVVSQSHANTPEGVSGQQGV